ncbi:MAG: DUF5804 family protein [Halodesulfurarchaeum sp.]
MTRVCFLGSAGTKVRPELLSYETARSALSPYELFEPFENSLAVETISLGAAVSLLNDLDWYLARVAEESLVLEPSISREEWLSRDLAHDVRDGIVDPESTGSFLKIYGLEDDSLVEPMYAKRREGSVPDYDLRDVEDTVVVRVTESEFGEPG